MMKIVMLLVLVCASTLDAWGPGRGGGGGGGRFSGGKGPGGAGGRFQGGRGPGEQGTGGAGRRFQGGRGPGEQGTVGAGRRFPDGKGPGGAGGRRELSCDMIPEDRSCPPFEREVCGTDGNTYSNICELMKVRCYGDDSTVEVDYPCACGSDDCARPTPGGRPTPDKRPDFGGERQRPSGAGRPDVERPSAQEINGKPDGRRPPHGREPHGRGPHGRGPHGRGPHGGGPHRRGPHGRRPDLARLNISVVCNMSENCSPKLNKTVCGTDNITYSTFCELLAVKCETEDTDLAFEHPGDCGEGFNPDPEKRQQFCEMQFEECENRTADIDDVLICGSDNVTYNRCEFKRARCLDIFLTIAKRGECTEDQGDPEKYCVKCPFSFDGGRSEGGRPDGGKPEGRGGQETRGRPDRGKPKGLGKPEGRGGQENRGRPDSGKPKGRGKPTERGGQENRGRPDSGKPKGRGKPENRGGQENRGRQDGGEQEDGRRHHGGSHHGRSHHGGSHHGRHHGGGRRPHHGTEHPVCGTDGVTYPSACELKREACLLRDFELDIETFGPCATSETITEGPIDP